MSVICISPVNAYYAESNWSSSRKERISSASEAKRQVMKMLYQDKTLGHARIGARVVARLATMLGGRRYTDLDLLAMNPHLRRDIGADNLGDTGFLNGEIWRK